MPSQILRQFKPSLDELTAHEYLEKWRIEKTTDRKAYKIILFHGPKFHRDRRKRIEQKSQATKTPLVIGESEAREPVLPEPGKIETPPAPKPEPVHKPRRAKAAAAQAAAPHIEPAGEHETSDIGPQLVDQLASRGLMPSSAIKLLVSVKPRLEQVPDYIEYWDFVRAGKDVGPGLLYDLIKNSDPLPSNFETSRQKADRKAADERRERLVLAKQTLQVEYEEYRRSELDRYINEVLPKDEFDKLFAAERKNVSSQQSLWSRNLPPDTIEQIAIGGVRSQLAKHLTLLSLVNADFSSCGSAPF